MKNQINSEWVIKKLEKSDEVVVIRMGGECACIKNKINRITFRICPYHIIEGKEIQGVEWVCKKLGITPIKTIPQKINDIIQDF
jgi:hypothetical protein